MAAIHETFSTLAGTLVPPERSAAATPFGDSGPSLRRGSPDAFQHYADLCSGVLREARSLAAAGRYGQVLRVLLARASDLLDDIDEFLVALNPLRDGDAYLRAAELHRALEEVQARVPRQFRGRRFAAK